MMKLLPYIMMVIVLGILALSVIYVANKFAWIFAMASTRPMYILFSILPVFVLGTMGFFINSTGYVQHLIFKFSAIIMGIYLFMVVSFLVLDLLNLILHLSPATYGIITFSLTVIIAVGGYVNSITMRTTEHEIPIKNLKEEIKAVHLSDVHIGHFRSLGYIDKLVDRVNAQNPDVIFITGDYLDSRYALKERYFAPLNRLSAPVYFVDGNHDHMTDTDSILNMMRNAGVNVLQNEVADFKGLQVVGLIHMLADRNSNDMHASEENPTVQETLPALNIDPERPSVILHHSPSGIKYAADAGIDLYLAGHTHAGQIWPFNYIVELMYEYNRGLHTFKDTKVFVSEGVGTVGPPFRIGTKSEIVVLRLFNNNTFR